MAKLTLVQVKTDTSKVYNPSDKFNFELIINSSGPINEDVVFEVFYFGDAYSDDHDQKICHNIIGPLEAGKQSFELETSPIDLTKIPIKTLFGLTTILIVGKFRGEQFIRIGYVVNVSYPGVDDAKLLDVEEDSEGIEMQDDEEDDDDDDYEDLEDDEDNKGNAEEDGTEVNAEDDETGVNAEDKITEELESSGEKDADNAEDLDTEEDECDEHSSCDHNIEEALAEALMPNSNRKPIPLATPILPDQDDFFYKKLQMPMKKSKIELTLLENPIIHTFDIEWDGEADNEESEDAQCISSENENNIVEEPEFKRTKTE